MIGSILDSLELLLNISDGDGWSGGLIDITVAEVEVDDYETGSTLITLGVFPIRLFNKLCLNDYRVGTDIGVGIEYAYKVI